jgi:diguanylate cyclase (GGDEF)-like protein
MVRLVEQMPRFVRVLVACLLLLVVALADTATGTDLNLQFFYLFPIVFLAWFDGRASALALGVASTLAVLGAGTSWLVTLVRGLVGNTPWLADTRADNAPWWNAAVAGAIFVSFALALSTLRAALQRLAELSHTDPLTEISNRRSFLETAATELARARRTGHGFALMYIDLDNFKHVNDTLGHQAGDSLLRTVSAELRSAVRATDVVARLGGDEFAVLLPETDAGGAADAAAKVRSRLHGCMSLGGWPVTFSIGVVSSGRLPESIETMLDAADRLMYSVKKSGKNGIAAQAL